MTCKIHIFSPYQRYEFSNLFNDLNSNNSNFQLQNDKRTEITTTDRTTSLRLLDTNRDDRGEYAVRATNDLGEDTASVLVTITGAHSH